MSNHADWSNHYESGTPFAMRFLRWLALRAPRPVASAVLWTVCVFFVSQSDRPTTRASRNYLTRLDRKQPDLWQLHRHAFNFAQVAIDRPRFLQFGMAAFDIHVVNPTPVHEALAQSKGAILLGAHFGSFEALRAFDRMLPALDVRYLMFGDHAEASTRLLGELNEDVEDRVIPLKDGPGAMLAVSNALQEGCFIAFLGDRQPEGALGDTIEVSFLGDAIRIPKSPYMTAMAARVPLILCFAPRLPSGRYLIEFLMIYDGAQVQRHERDAKCREFAEKYVQYLEGLCRRHPDNWFNFFDIWGDGMHRVDSGKHGHPSVSRFS